MTLNDRDGIFQQGVVAFEAGRLSYVGEVLECPPGGKGKKEGTVPSFFPAFSEAQV